MSDDINLDSGSQRQQNQRIRYPIKRDFINLNTAFGASDTISLRPQQGAVNLNQPSPRNKEVFEEALKFYKLGVDGDKESVHKSHDLLNRILQAAPENRQAEAYLGCVTSLLGRDAEDPGEQFKYALEGLKMLDKVVTAEPENIEFRGLRAFVCQKLPEMYFHRSKTAIEDFSYLVSQYEQKRDLLSKDYFQQILFELGAAFNRIGLAKEAENTWQKLLSITDDAKYEKLIKAEGYNPKPAAPQPTPYHYAPPIDYDYLMKEGVALHNRALANDSKAAEKAFKLFQRAHKANPEDPLIKAYYADLLSLTRKDSTETSTVIGNAMKAIKLLDQALNTNPDNITITLLRANHSFRLPEAFFRRTLTAVNDYNFLIEEYEKDPSILPEEVYWQILYNLGASYKRLEMDDEAKEVWLKLAQINNSKYREAILAQLDDISSHPFEENSDNFEELLQEGIRLHDLAVSGNKRASQRALELLQRVYEADPTNTLAEGYYGSSIALAGRDSMDPKGMFASAHKGLAYLNKAIERDPNNYRLRLLRAYFLHNLPKQYFSNFDDPIKDFRFLKMAYERNHSLFSEELYGKIVYDLGVCYQRTGQIEKAQKIWNGLLKKGINSNDPELSQSEEEIELEEGIDEE